MQEQKFKFDEKKKRTFAEINLISFLLNIEPTTKYKNDLIDAMNEERNSTKGSKLEKLDYKSDTIPLVFETVLGAKRVYTCFVDAKKENNNLSFSVRGIATLDAMVEYVKNEKNAYKFPVTIIQEIIPGDLFFIIEQIMQTIERTEHNTPICFWSDLKKLGGNELIALNVHMPNISIGQIAKDFFIGEYRTVI